MQTEPPPGRRARRRTCALLALAVAVATAGCGVTFRHSYTRDELRARLAKRFPIERQKAVFVLRLADPDVTFPGGDRLGLSANVEVLALGALVGRGRATLDGVPSYRPEDGGVYVRDPVLRSLTFDGASPERAEKARQVASAAIARLFAERPLYTLDPARSPQEARAREHLRRMWIEGDRLMIEFAL
jgi:hypothetical protein